MRAKRSLLILAGAASALAVAVAAALSPAVQTWAARRMMASMKGPAASIGRLSVGFDRAALEGLRVETGSAVLTAPSINAEMGVISAGLGRGYHFRSFVAKGWTLDLTGPRGAVAPPAEGGKPWPTRAIGGVLAAFNVPPNLSLDGVDLEGEVIFPDEGGRPAGRVRVVVTGGGLAAGHDGRFLCSATALVDDKAAPVSRIAVTATLKAAMEATGTFTRAELRADATASGRQFPDGIGLSCAASAARDAGNESYSVSLVRGSDRIAAIDAESPDGSAAVTGSWRLDLKDTDLAPFALGRSLPSFHVAGNGDFAGDAATGDVHAVGKLQVSADRLGVLAKELGPLGHVDLTADFDVARLGATLRVARLETSLSGATPVASVRALQSFEFNPLSGELKVAVPTGDLVGITVTGIPLSWIGAVLPGFDVSGSDAHGEFVMRAEDGRLALRTKAPLTAAGVALARSGRAIATGLEASAFVLADYAPQGWQVQLAPFAVRSEGGIKMFSLEARFGRLFGAGKAVKAEGSWSASLPVLLSMPAAAGIPGLSGGEASGSFEASLGSTSEVRIRLAARNLASASGAPVVLPSINSEVRADFDAGGRTTFSVPLRLDYGTRSADLALSGTVEADSGGPFVDVILEGTRLSEGDLAALAFLSGCGGAGAGPSGPSGAPAGSVPSGDVPFWPAFRGRISMRIEGVPFEHVELRDLRGTLHVDPFQITVEGGAASISEGSVARFGGQLSFSPGAERPYSLRADVSVDNVDSVPLLRTADPGRLPAIEGRFDIASHLTASGGSPGDLPGRVQGEFKLSSKDGKFRLLRTDIAASVKLAPSKLEGALDTVTALFGKKAGNIGQALVESANGLSEIHYDQMSVSAERGADLDLRITEISLIAPEERLIGKGRIAYSGGVPMQDQPLSIDMDLSVRGHLGKFLDLVGLLKEGHDELGYTPLNQPIHLGGSLRNVDQSQWKDMLIQASVRKGSGLIDKLLRR